jgi:IS30 family transposase
MFQSSPCPKTGCDVLVEHQQLATQLGLDVYVSDPRSPWQRGSNENTNRPLRQYLRKGANLRAFSMRDLHDIAGRVDTRPRPVLARARALGATTEEVTAEQTL